MRSTVDGGWMMVDDVDDVDDWGGGGGRRIGGEGMMWMKGGWFRDHQIS